MRQYWKNPQRQRTQGFHRRVGSTIPSIGLPSCYPNGSTIIVTGQKALNEESHITRTSLPDEDSLIMMMRLNHNESMSSLDDSFPPQRECSTTELRQPSEPTAPRPTPSKDKRRQRNRAFSDEDFAAIVNEYSADIL